MRILISTLAFAAAMSVLLFTPERVNAQTSIDYVVLHQNDFASGLTSKQTKVITTQEEYAAILAGYSNEAPHQIDFQNGQVLLVDMGLRLSGGFNIEVTSVEERSKGSVSVQVRLRRPGRTCLAASVLTNPFQFVYIPSRREILISENLETIECGPTLRFGK
ncbi:MAG: protease complex subunit PrcB family protein [Pyrinomonadaceae bacterium]